MRSIIRSFTLLLTLAQVLKADTISSNSFVCSTQAMALPGAGAHAPLNEENLGRLAHEMKVLLTGRRDGFVHSYPRIFLNTAEAMVDRELANRGFLHVAFSRYFRLGHPLVFAYLLYVSFHADARLFEVLKSNLFERLEQVNALITQNDEAAFPIGHRRYLKRVTPWLEQLLNSSKLLKGSWEGLCESVNAYQALMIMAPLDRPFETELRIFPLDTQPPLQARSYPPAQQLVKDRSPVEQVFLDRLAFLEKNGVDGLYLGSDERFVTVGVLPKEIVSIWTSAVNEAMDWKLGRLSRPLWLTAYTLYAYRIGVRFSEETWERFHRVIRQAVRYVFDFNSDDGPYEFVRLASAVLSPYVSDALLPDLLALTEAIRQLPDALRWKLQVWQALVQGFHGPPIRYLEAYDTQANHRLLPDLLNEFSLNPDSRRGQAMGMAICINLMSNYHPADTLLREALRRSNPRRLAEVLDFMAEKDWYLRNQVPIGAIRHALGGRWLSHRLPENLHSMFWDPLMQMHLFSLKTEKPARAGFLNTINLENFNAWNPYLLRIRYQELADHLRQLAQEVESESTTTSPRATVAAV